MTGFVVQGHMLKQTQHSKNYTEQIQIHGKYAFEGEKNLTNNQLSLFLLSLTTSYSLPLSPPLSFRMAHPHYTCEGVS